MKMNNLKMSTLKLCFTGMAIMSIAFFSACGDDETEQLPDPVTTPVIESIGLPNDTIMQVNRAFGLVPNVNANDGMTFSWKINGTEVATTRDYTFKPEETGKYEISYRVTNGVAYDEKTVRVHIYKYYGGFYIVNEGWFGHDAGSINYFDISADTIVTGIADECELGNTTQYGTIWNHVFYLVSKQGNRLVAMDMYDYSQVGKIEDIPDGRAFCGIDENRGVVTTADGAYIVNLHPLSLGAKLSGSDGQCGAVMYTNGRIFVNSQKNGVLVYDKTLKKEKTLEKVDVAFAQSKDGNLWAVKGQTLYCINPSSLSVETVTLPEGMIVAGNWGAWNAGGISASVSENVVYVAKAASAWGDGNEIYRYVIGDEASLNEPFAVGESDDAFYGGGFRCDPKSGHLVVPFTKKWGYNDNRLTIFSGKDGSRLKRIAFDYYWFPSLVVFN